MGLLSNLIRNGKKEDSASTPDVEVLGNEEEIEMTEDEKKKMEADAVSRGEAASTERLAIMQAAFPENAAFAIAAFQAGATPEAAKSMFDAAQGDVVALEAKIADLEKANGELEGENEDVREEVLDGADAAEHAGTPEVLSFGEMVEQHAKENKCTFMEAAKEINEKNPELFRENFEKGK